MNRCRHGRTDPNCQACEELAEDRAAERRAPTVTPAEIKRFGSPAERAYERAVYGQ